MKAPRIMITAGASGSGKTLLTCGILQALKERGLKPASFKCGPDYIDPMFHSRVLETKSRNLDTFFTTSQMTRALFLKNAAGADISVMEGVMGYYDGVGGMSTQASAYELAAVTETPAILIVNCKGMSVSILPFIKGFLTYEKNSRIEGVILNQISPMLYPRVKKMVEEQLSVHVYGYVPKLEDCVLESRHLGLVLPQEVGGLREKLKELASVLEKTLELSGLIQLAQSAKELSAVPMQQQDVTFAFRLEEPVTLGVASDEAFCFFYEDNFALLQEMGARLRFFSPLHDEKVPEGIDGLLFYGGYPELYAAQLEKNTAMRQSVRAAIDSGMPCMAECGGFMYLHTSMEDMEGKAYRMAGVIDGHAFRTEKLSRFGYISLEGSVFGQDANVIRGHEFHYFDSSSCGETLTAQKPLSGRSWKCCHGGKTLLAGFPHLYYYGNPNVPKVYLTRCLAFQKKRSQT